VPNGPKSPPSAPGDSFLCIAEFFWVLGLRRDPILALPAFPPPLRPELSFLAGAAAEKRNRIAAAAATTTTTCPRRLKGQS
jgi:hypothetical protein